MVKRLAEQEGKGVQFFLILVEGNLFGVDRFDLIDVDDAPEARLARIGE